MKKAELFAILEDWNFWRQDLDSGIGRPFYLEKIGSYLKNNYVLVITGPRRTGKSYLMRQFIRQLIDEEKVPRESILMVNFEDPRFEKRDAKLLQKIYEVYLANLDPQKKPYIFLDEIQEVENWERWVRTIHELKKATVIISGSNSDLLNTELASTLTGRHLDLTIFPLSFREFLDFREIPFHSTLDLTHHKTDIQKAMGEYIEFGGFPEVVLSPQKKEILLGYFGDILDKDVIHRYRIRKKEELTKLAKFYLSNISSLMSFNSIQKNLSITTPTIERYSSHFEASYLTFLLKRFSFKVKEQDKSPRKVYSIDTGLSNTIGFRFSANKGRLAENIVFLELARRVAYDPSLELFYWKDEKHREVDFLVKKDLKAHQLIQASWDISGYKTKEREVKSLLLGMEDLNKSEGLIITDDFEGEERIDKKTLRYTPLWKWLLQL